MADTYIAPRAPDSRAVLPIDETTVKGPLPTDGPDNVIRKVSFNLYQADINMLRELSAWARMNVTQCLRSAIATEHFLRNAARNNERIFLEAPNGDRREIVFR